MATSNDREARRRKIVDRGSDRLALITGRIQNLRSPPPDSSPLANSLPRGPLSTFSPSGEDEASGSTLQKHDGGSRAESSLPESGTRAGELRAPASEVSGRDESGKHVEASKVNDSEVSGKVQSSPLDETDQSSSVSTVGAEQSLEPRSHQQGFFSSNQIISAIKASEATRLYCSVSVALLVVLSHLGFPLLGCNLIKDIIGFRPLFLVLLTNLTIVLARLLLDKPGGFQRPIREENKNTSSDDYGWAEQVSKALEVSFVMQKVMDSAFMDCSIYAVIVICGLVFA